MIRLKVGALRERDGDQTRLTLAVAGGGTAGHVIPGLAVFEQWRRLAPQAEVLFLGGKGGFEERFVPPAGIELIRLPSSPFARQRLGGKLLAGVNAGRATLTALKLFRERRPGFVLGLGGYASAPAMAAARWAGIPCALHEANVEPGLGNRLTARLVDCIFVGWRETGACFSGAPTELVGNPLPHDRLPGAARAPRKAGGPRVLALGGSEGSPQLNERAPELLARTQSLLGRTIEVHHVCGWGDRAAVEARYREAGVKARVDEFVEHVAALYADCDVAVVTAGSFTLAELTAWRIPALLAPLEGAAARHQHANAAAFAARTGALLEWDPRGLAALLASPEALAEAAARMGRAFEEGAAESLARACLELIRSESG